MSSPDFTNFERRGNTDNDLVLETRDEVFVKLLHEIESSVRSIKIYSHDLEHQLLHNDAVRSHLLSFIRENRHASIQILVDDIDPALKEGHMLISFAQHMTTAVNIKETPEDYLGSRATFILFDQQRFIFRPDRKYDWSIYSECKFRSATLDEFFSFAWDQAAPCVNTRRMYI